MESNAHSGHRGGPDEGASAGRAGVPDDTLSGRSEVKDRATERPAQGADRPAAGIPAAVSSGESDPAVEQIKQLLLREGLRFRQNTSGSMTVVVCLDDGAELLVHFAQRDGGIDAIARCEPGDAPRLGALWPRLQRALAPRRIQLAPLRSSLAQRPAASSANPSSFHPDRPRHSNELPANRPGWETWA